MDNKRKPIYMSIIQPFNLQHHIEGRTYVLRYGFFADGRKHMVTPYGSIERISKEDIKKHTEDVNSLVKQNLDNRIVYVVFDNGDVASRVEKSAG